MRRLIDVVTEFQEVPEVSWSMPPIPETAVEEGHVNTKAGLVDVFVGPIQSQTTHFTKLIGLWGRLRETGEVVANIALGEIPGDYVVLHHAYTIPEFSRKSIISEIINFVIRVMNTPLINDTQLTGEGMALVKYFNSKFRTSVVYIPTGEKFGIADIGKTTKDGQKIVAPEDDYFSDVVYSSTKHEGQKFFYLWESNGNFCNIVEGKTYIYGVNPDRHTVKMSGTPRYFYEPDAP